MVLLVMATHAEEWRGLVVADEDRCTDYEERDYSYSPRLEDAIVDSSGNVVLGPYTCTLFGSKGDTDIEHIVARSEAHDSGLCDAPASVKKHFASDLLNLTLASPSVNRVDKGAKDAAEWLPERNRCWFANRVLEVRKAYGLTIDRSEADALEAILSRCSAGDRRDPYCRTRSFVIGVIVPVVAALEARDASDNSR